MTSKVFSKILVANRGEIALRVMRSCAHLGIASVSIHSEVDENSLHVKLSDESVCVGPSRADQSYLSIPQILSAAEITQADAVHPGYGFLSENVEFARSCEQWGLTFIGPRPECIELLGSKVRSKEVAIACGVPTLRPILVDELTQSEIKEKCDEIGYPVLIKSSHGGGGKGMRIVRSEASLFSDLSIMSEEAKKAFGNGEVFIEKYIENPRHVEVQILADKHGNVYALGERDCTIQRRFQKIVEEAPCPVMPEEVRQEMFQAAIRLAKEVDYDSAGTVEFLYDQDAQKFYFMEVNTRIQVEHPVTEELFNVDLIGLMIRSAQGEEIKLTPEQLQPKGHVIEFRINAQDWRKDLPRPGRIEHYHRPGGLGIRVDDFIYSGYMVPPYYDSMLAKVIVKGATRDECIARSKRALKETIIAGLETNLELHRLILDHPDFPANRYSTKFLEQILAKI